MPQDSPAKATSKLFADLVKTPVAQALARRMEAGGVQTFSGIAASAQPFFAALLQKLFPHQTVVVVTENLKAQESFQQDLETWLDASPQFYPAWEILPHEEKLPHADVISDRLQTLVALSDNSKFKTKNSKLIVTSFTALLQKTFPPGEIQERTRTFERGSKIAPLDLIEFLEEQGYEPEAQVSQKGEIALRGGIVDIFPPTSPWPVRLDFFGDELESLREFDPLTQVSRGEITSVTLPPAGELGILKSRSQKPEARSQNETAFATLLDYLPRETIFLLCEPDSLAVHADGYEQQVPKDDPFFISWPDLLVDLNRCKFTSIQLMDGELDGTPSIGSASEAANDNEHAELMLGAPLFASLDAFRPLAERAPEPQIAEAQRREFFQQLHRWLRQDFSVNIFCNNDGERQRFEEIWREHGFGAEEKLAFQIGSLARGFICDEAKIVVVTDAEIFGRYKIQRPRRQKNSHAQAARSALDIDFTDLEEGDLVVHLQHGIGRYRGLKMMPVGNSRHVSTVNNQSSAETECLVVEYAPANDGEESPKLYVPVSEARCRRNGAPDVGRCPGHHPAQDDRGGAASQRAALPGHRRVHQLRHLGLRRAGTQYLRQRILPQAGGHYAGAVLRHGLGRCAAPRRRRSDHCRLEGVRPERRPVVSRTPLPRG